MHDQPAFGFQHLIPELVRGLADAVTDRPGETEAERFARHRTAIFSVMAFLPRDAMETLLASHCVMYDHILRDATADLLRSEGEPAKRRLRSQIAATGRLFLASVKQLHRLQARPSQQPAAATETAQEAPSPPMARSAEEATVQPSCVAVEPRATSAEPVSPQGFAGSGPHGLPPQHGLQNRQMRRALQFKKPVGNRVSARSAMLAMASQSAAPSA